jgi:hypothetical protein
MLNPLKKMVKLNIPLSDINYHPPDIGISFKWNQLQLLIPYHRLPIKASIGSLLEEFKNSLEGTGDIDIHLECHLFTFNIEIMEVKINKVVIQRFTDFISSIERIVNQIKAQINGESLNLEKGQIILYQNGFQYDDSKVHRILEKIINSLPPRKIVEKLHFPLSNLSYHSKGIRFFNKNTQFEVEKNKLPVEVGPAMERIKNNFTGDITFHIETAYLQRWDTNQGQLQSGAATREIKEIEISPNVPGIFKTLRGQFITESIKELINDATISLESVKRILEDWGLNLKHQEIGYQLISSIIPWTEEKDFKVPLKNVFYHDDGIVVPVAERNIRISAKNLSFETNQLFENIKQSFEGYINIHVYQFLQFVWDKEKEQLKIEKKKSLKIKISMDDATINRLRKIYWLYVEKGVDISDDNRNIDQYKAETPGIKENIEEVETMETDAAEEINKAARNPEEKPGQEYPLIDLPKAVDHIPISQLKNKDYDPQCIHRLEKMADQIYMTSHDLWFRIGDRLIWEQPENDSRTYIFKWPDEDLEFFVCKIWAMELREIREEKDENGYITRINHIPDDVLRWERNLKRALKKKV